MTKLSLWNLANGEEYDIFVNDIRILKVKRANTGDTIKFTHLPKSKRIDNGTISTFDIKPEWLKNRELKSDITLQLNMQNSRVIHITSIFDTTLHLPKTKRQLYNYEFHFANQAAKTLLKKSQCSIPIKKVFKEHLAEFYFHNFANLIHAKKSTCKTKKIIQVDTDDANTISISFELWNKHAALKDLERKAMKKFRPKNRSHSFLPLLVKIQKLLPSILNQNASKGYFPVELSNTNLILVAKINFSVETQQTPCVAIVSRISDDNKILVYKDL